MIDISNILKRFTSRLAIAFVVMIWAVATYPAVNPWIFVAGYAIFMVGYSLTKMFGSTDLEIIDEIEGPITINGKFNPDDIGEK